MLREGPIDNVTSCYRALGATGALGCGIEAARTCVRRVAIRVRVRVQGLVQRPEQDCACLPRNTIESSRTGSGLDKHCEG